MIVVQISTDRIETPPKKGGAIETYVWGISNSLAKKGVKVHLISIGAKNGSSVINDNLIKHTLSIKSFIPLNNSKIFSFTNSYKNIPYVSWKVYRILTEIQKKYEKPELIHVHFPSMIFGPLLYKYFINEKVINLFHFHNEPSKRNVSYRINKLIANRYDFLFGVSNYVTQQIMGILNLHPSKVTTIYNAIDTKFFKPCKIPEKLYLRRKYNLDERTFIMTFIGRLVPEKGLHLLVKAIDRIVSKGYKNIRLLVVGPKGHFYQSFHEYAENLFTLINHLGLQNKIIYIGRIPREQLPQIYCVSDVVVVPSLWQDPCPSVVLESLSSGIPVIGFASGGIPEITCKNCGVVIPQKSLDALTRALITFIEKNIEFDKNQMRKYIEKHFSYDAVTNTLITVYEYLQNHVT